MKKLLCLLLSCLLPLGMVACGDDSIQVTAQIQPMEELTYEEIWEIANPVNLVVELDMWIAKKCEYGDRMEALSEAERIFYVNNSLEMEVNNGGFAQFFFNSSGAFAAEVEQSLRAIGADATADICKKAVEAFGQPLPLDQLERDKLLEEIFTDEIAEILDGCDETFFQYQDDLAALNYQFVMEHRDQFTE